MSGPRNRIVIGDAATSLQAIAPVSIDIVLTSPPYYRLRNYQIDGQLGLEQVVDEWVDNLISVAREIRRVLVPTGTLWLNVGDTYSTNIAQGAGRKSLLLAPERLALRLIADGWLLRNKIVWRKANPMPTSVRDRLACTWEIIYIFAKQPSYFFDLDSIRVPHTPVAPPRERRTALVPGREAWRGPNSVGVNGLAKLKAQGLVGHPLGKNPGDLWQLASSNYRGSHRATFPLALAERIVLAGAPEARCMLCRLPRLRQAIRTIGGTAVRGTLGPSCGCDAPTEPGIVLDPFMGSGTTAIAADRHGRDWLGIELNPEFAHEANGRIQASRGSPSAA